ncbi:phage portal protein [Oricola thermophila]|uniref:Phage portal protein n=1 Tax=Oricola thermophila TaxID=2742145 RepID=A0A6N1VH77_9HYPH|nr:phage portal protein [Oricola thermophila]QKV20250.1 phage portal protein [Oricola thermophila]
MANPIDRVIGFFSPEAGLRRAGARELLEHYNHERAYAAARNGRRNKSWSGRSTSANAEIGSSLTQLRNRSREFVRDSWAGARMLDVLTSHVVGTGIVTTANTGSDRIDRRVNAVLEEWSANADVEGVLDWGGMQALAVRSMVEGGDVVVRHVDIPLADAGRTVPVRLQGLEGDVIDTTRDITFGKQGRTVRLGVELGEWGRRIGLHLFENHPGEMTLSSRRSNLVEWESLSHVYRPLRFGQVRGVPWFAAILLNAREVQELMDATLVKARVEACFAAFRRRGASGGPGPLASRQHDDADGKKITRIEPGMIADIGDDEISFANPSSQTAFGEVYKTSMQAMAAGAMLTYDQLTGDLSQANYSSLRAGKIEFRRLVEQIQWTVLVPQLIAPVAQRVIDRAVIAGRLPYRRAGYPLDHIMPAVEPIDPKKDLEADILAVRAGRMSPQEFVSAWGHDWRKVVADSAAFWKAVDEYKDHLSLDIDGRKQMKGSANDGQANAKDAD